MRIRWKAVWITVLFLAFLCPHRARAAEVEDYDFSEIQEILTDSGSERISFSELVDRMLLTVRSARSREKSAATAWIFCLGRSGIINPIF